ncbi:hypothetical protein MRX96_020263 [Rhipicephalus microplus]
MPPPFLEDAPMTVIHVERPLQTGSDVRLNHLLRFEGVTVSPWSNVVASCDASGKVAAVCLPYLSSNLDFVKNHTKMRLPLFQATLVPLGKEQVKGSAQQGDHLLASEQYGISFEDNLLVRHCQSISV